MPQHEKMLADDSRPFKDNFVLIVGKIFVFLLFATLVISVAYLFWIGWIFSAKPREFFDSTFLSIVIYVVAVCVLSAWGYLWIKAAQGLLLGKPAFGKLGGMPQRLFSTAIRARAQISVELSKHDMAEARMFNTINLAVIHDLLKDRFEDIKRAEGLSEDEISKSWDHVWNDEVLELTVDGQTFRDAADIERFGLNYAMSSLMRSTIIIPVISNLFWITSILLLYLYLIESISLLTSIQICLSLTFVFAAFWHMVVLHNLSAFPMDFDSVEMLESTRNRFAGDIQKLTGKEIRPKKISVKPRFYEIFRNYQLTTLIFGAIGDVLGIFIVVFFGYLLIYALDADHAKALSHYYVTVASGVTAAAAFLTLGFYFFSVALQNLRKIAAAVIVSLLTALLPFLIDYIFAGELDISGAREAIIAGTSGLTVALITTVTSHIKETME